MEERDRCGLTTELEDLHGLLVAGPPEPVRRVGDLSLGGLEAIHDAWDRAGLDRVDRVTAVLVVEEVLDLTNWGASLLGFHG